jgi:hypothetical protein
LAQKTYKDDETYDVRLTGIASLGPLTYKPAGAYEMTGAFIKKLIEANGETIIDRATPKS